jgi:hypothetical protein
MLALALALGAPASAQSPSPRVVNGHGATISQFPYQVAVFNGFDFCGGVVKDATTVITAAHCVVDLGAELSAPSQVQVLAGSTSLSSPDPGSVSSGAATLSIDSQYDPNTADHDVAEIGLAQPLWTGPTPPANIKPIGVIDDNKLTPAIASGATVTVSGWGCTSAVPPGSNGCPTSLPDTLQAADIPLIKDSTCQNDYAAVGVPISGNMFCAGADSSGSTLRDSCFGDSGGPLTLTSSGTKFLAGIVDSGDGCAQPNLPGIYARVSKLGAFLDTADPALTGTPAVGGKPAVGQTLTCNPGAWSGNPTLTFRFVRDASGVLSPLTNYDLSPAYTVTGAAAGTNVFCEVKATGANAIRVAQSPEVFVQVAPLVTPQQPPPGAPADTVAPSLRVLKRSCTSTACTVRVKVTDRAPSSGIARVRALLAWTRKARCARHSRAAAKSCTKRVQKSLTAHAKAGGIYVIVAKGLKPATRYTLTLVPFDKAGHRPRVAVTTTFKTKPQRSSRRRR